MRRPSLVAAVSLATLLIARPGEAQTAGAQPPTLVPAPPNPQPAPGAPEGCTCSADLRWVTVRVRRADGSAVADARIRVRDARTNRVVHADSTPLNPGGDEYVAVQDGEVRLALDEPVTLVVEARWRGRTRSARIQVGTKDRCGCHVTRVGAPTTITFP